MDITAILSNSLFLCSLYSPPAIRLSSSVRHSTTRFRPCPFFAAPSRGACGAPVAHGCLRRTQIGTPYTPTQDARERACDRRADASLDPQPGNARLAFIAHRREAPAAIDFTNRRAGLRETSCGPSDGIARLAALHVGFLARARARRCPAFAEATAGKPAKLATSTETTRLKPLLKASQGGSACPPGSCAFRRTGHRYPEERVSRASPARSLTASGTPRPRSALQGRP
jgi:hypothetical protein